MVDSDAWTPPLSYDEIFRDQASNNGGAAGRAGKERRIGAGRIAAVLFVFVSIVVVASVGAVLYWDTIDWNIAPAAKPIGMNSIASHQDLLVDPPPE